MPDERHPGTDRELYEFAAVNRTRIDAIEAELSRMRTRMHELESTASVIRWYGQKVDDVATGLTDLTNKLDVLSRRAVERPSASAWGVVVQLVVALVAIIALIVSFKGG